MNTENSSSSKDDHHEMQPPGFRFHPTDEELLRFYLRRKVDKKPIVIELIKEIDVYKHDPWDLPSMTSYSSVYQLLNYLIFFSYLFLIFWFYALKF